MWVAALVLLATTGASGAVAGPWWSNAVYYRILVDSFKDSDGDGLGDLTGVTKQLSYVSALGADAVILSPLTARSPDCSKPGVIDFSNIDPRYGDDASMKSLLEKAKKLELKMVVSLDISTVSIGSEWFNLSAQKETGFGDRLVWLEQTPDLRIDTVDLKAWTWNPDRAAFFASVDNEAIVNLCSGAVTAALSSAQCDWLKAGFDGILLNPDFKSQYCGEQLLKKMAAEASSCAWSAALETPVVLVESSLSQHVASAYYANEAAGASGLISTALTQPESMTAANTALAFYDALLHAPQDKIPIWATSASKASRTATRYGNHLVDAVNLLSLILPGSTLIQQGDELGVADTLMEWTSSSTCRPVPPYPSAAPFPWTDGPNGGFTGGEPWIPLALNYRYANAKTEFANDNSHVGVMKTAAAMRKSPAMGPQVDIKQIGNALAVLRWGGAGSLLVVANLGRDQTEVRLSIIHGIPPEMTVATSSAGSSLSPGTHVVTDKPLKMIPGEALLLAGGPRHCGGPGPVDKIANKLSEGWQKINKYFSSS